MGANATNGPLPSWLALYEAAVIEVNHDHMPQRIDEAENAVMNRMEDVNRSDGAESEALMNALSVLRDLRRIAEG